MKSNREEVRDMRTLRSGSEPPLRKFILRFDGGSSGNPGPSAFCYIVMDECENVLCIHSEYIGIETNNFSEYMGFLKGLEYLVNFTDPSRCEIKVETDSELIVKQMSGEYSIRNSKLRKVANTVKDLLVKFRNYDISHIPRGENTADEFVRRVLTRWKRRKNVKDCG